MAENTHEESVPKLRDLMKSIRICMMSTVDEQGRIHSRPMYMMQTEGDAGLWFFTHAAAGKAHEVERHPEVNVSFSNDNQWVSVSGSATLVRDQNKIDELWRDDLKAFFPKGKQDPDVALLKVDAESAEYWDTPSSAIVRLYGFAKARLTGKPYGEEMGDHQKIEL